VWGRANDCPAVADQKPKKDSELTGVLLAQVEVYTAGDPMSTRKWLNCRLQDLQDKLVALGHQVSLPMIRRLLKLRSYRLHINRKTVEGKPHPERNRQFEYIRAELLGMKKLSNCA